MILIGSHPSCHFCNSISVTIPPDTAVSVDTSVPDLGRGISFGDRASLGQWMSSAFSGYAEVGSMCAAASHKGLQFRAFDINRARSSISPGPSEDLLSREGFRHALSLVLQVRKGGLVWMAPVCSSFVFMNSSNTARRVERLVGQRLT